MCLETLLLCLPDIAYSPHRAQTPMGITLVDMQGNSGKNAGKHPLLILTSRKKHFHPLLKHFFRSNPYPEGNELVEQAALEYAECGSLKEFAKKFPDGTKKTSQAKTHPLMTFLVTRVSMLT